jgi:hypothetical protein
MFAQVVKLMSRYRQGTIPNFGHIPTVLPAVNCVACPHNWMQRDRHSVVSTKPTLHTHTHTHTHSHTHTHKHSHSHTHRFMSHVATNIPVLQRKCNTNHVISRGICKYTLNRRQSNIERVNHGPHWHLIYCTCSAAEADEEYWSVISIFKRVHHP